MLFPPTFEHLGVLQLIKHLRVGMQMVTTTTVVCQPRPKELDVGTNHRLANKWQHATFQKQKEC